MYGSLFCLRVQCVVACLQSKRGTYQHALQPRNVTMQLQFTRGVNFDVLALLLVHFDIFVVLAHQVFIAADDVLWKFRGEGSGAGTSHGDLTSIKTFFTASVYLTCS